MAGAAIDAYRFALGNYIFAEFGMVRPELFPSVRQLIYETNGQLGDGTPGDDALDWFQDKVVYAGQVELDSNTTTDRAEVLVSIWRRVDQVAGEDDFWGAFLKPQGVLRDWQEAFTDPDWWEASAPNVEVVARDPEVSGLRRTGNIITFDVSTALLLVP